MKTPPATEGQATEQLAKAFGFKPGETILKGGDMRIKPKNWTGSIRYNDVFSIKAGLR